MQALLAVMLAGRAGIPRSARLPQLMAAVAAVQAQGLLLRLLADQAVVKEPRGERLHHLERMGAVAVVVPAVHLVSVLSSVGAVVVDALHQPCQMVGHTHVMAELVVVVVVVQIQSTLRQTEPPAGRALERLRVLLLALVVLQGRQELPVLLLLLEDCSGKVVVVAAVVLLARAVQAVLEAVALVAAVAVLRAVHTLLAPVV